jgi:hypothetical protein
MGLGDGRASAFTAQQLHYLSLSKSHREGSRPGAKGLPPLLRAGGPGIQGPKGLLGPPRRATRRHNPQGKKSPKAETFARQGHFGAVSALKWRYLQL